MIQCTLGQDRYSETVETMMLTAAGCRAVPGMCPADFREALYSTWMTGRPWGMKLIDCDSDGEGLHCSSTDEVHCIHLLS